MTEQDAIAMLVECEKNPHTEIAHSDADQIICDFVKELGYPAVVSAWESVSKWYA